MSYSSLTEYLQDLQKRLPIPDMDLWVWKDHEPQYRYTSGTHCEENALYWLYSATKPVTAVAALQLVQKGQLSLDAPVSTYLPEFHDEKVREHKGCVPVKTPMTVSHLFSMQAGFNYDFSRPALQKLLREKSNPSTRMVVAALAEDPLDFEPGTHFAYSFCLDVLGAVIEAVSGQTLGKYMDDNIFSPLGITQMGFHLSPSQLQQLVPQYRYNPQDNRITPIGTGNFCQVAPAYESGGGGLYGTLEDYCRLADALACGGVGANGARILESTSISLLQTNLLGPASMQDFRRRYTRPGYGYGYGVRVCTAGDNPEPKGCFGWDGAAGAHVMIDPVNHLSLVYLQHVQDMEVLYDGEFPKMDALLYQNA